MLNSASFSTLKHYTTQAQTYLKKPKVQKGLLLGASIVALGAVAYQALPSPAPAVQRANHAFWDLFKAAPEPSPPPPLDDTTQIVCSLLPCPEGRNLSSFAKTCLFVVALVPVYLLIP